MVAAAVSAGLATAGSVLTSGAAIGAGAILCARSGGSRRKVYSRTSRPDAQVNSTSMSMNGSFKGRSVLTSRYRRPPRSLISRENRKVAKAGAYSIPAWRKASAAATLAISEGASSRVAVTSSSALSGCPKAECTVIFPSPAACVASGRTAIAAAITVALRRFRLSVLGTVTPDGLFIMLSKRSFSGG